MAFWKGHSILLFRNSVSTACSIIQLYTTLCDPIDCSLPGPLSILSRQEYWSGLPFPSPEGYLIILVTMCQEEGCVCHSPLRSLKKHVQELLLCREPKLNYVGGAESRAKGYAKPLPVYYTDNSFFSITPYSPILQMRKQKHNEGK